MFGFATCYLWSLTYYFCRLRVLVCEVEGQYLNDKIFCTLSVLALLRDLVLSVQLMSLVSNSKKPSKPGRTWWCSFVMPVLRRLRQEGGTWGEARLYRETLSPKTKPKQKIWSQGVMATDLTWKNIVLSEMDLCSPVVHENLLDSTY